MNKLIILLGQRVRSGTNFVGSTLAQHPDVITLPETTSLGEFNLFNTDDISECFNVISKNSFGMNLGLGDMPLFLKFYGEAWLNFLVHKYKIDSSKVIFIKSPNINHIKLWQDAFPNSKIAVIYRDGRDNVISSIRASNDKRSWHTLGIKFKKRLNFWTGRSFVSHCKAWQKTAMLVANITECINLKKIKYEDLNNSEQHIKQLLEFYELNVDDFILNKCLEAPVVGSSFGVDSKDMTKPNWKPDHNKSKFKFSRKWIHWNILKKSVFKSIAGKELIALDYEANNNW